MNKYFYQHKWKFGVFLLVSMLGAVSVIMMTYVVQLLVESITEMNLEKLKIVSVLATVYVLIDSYFDYLVEIVNEKLLQAIMKDLRSDLIQKLYQIDIATTQLIDVNDYLNLFTNDLHIISENYLKEIFSMYNDVWTLVIAVIMSLSIQPVFSIIMILMSSMPILLPKFTPVFLGNAKLRLSKSNKKYLSILSDLLQGLTTLKFYKAFSGMNKRLELASEELKDSYINSVHANRLVYAISYGLRGIVNISSWIIGGFFVITGQLSFPVFFTVKQLINYVAYPIQGFGNSYIEVVSAKSVVKKVLNFIEEESHVKIRVENQTSEIIQSIYVTNATIGTENNVLLHDINLVINQNEKYLIIGESGSGKTTLVKSIVGIASLLSGERKAVLTSGIMCDIQNIFDLVSYIPQSSEIFDISVYENVNLFQNYTSDQVIRAMGKAVLLDWLNENSIETRANNLSGGEKRRLDLSRAILFDKQMIVLDEVTSGLDHKNRLLIEDTILQMDQKIILYITHHYTPELVQKFDKVIRVADKKVEILTPQEFLNRE